MPKYFVYTRKSSETEDKQVLSLESQQKELDYFIKREKLQIVERIEGESQSAKQPGRPVFNAMIKRIENGEADGIVAWHPDRLARNSVDGGQIIYLLDTGKLKDLRFPTYRFECDSQGKFMLNLIFGQSKYYVDSLSENVKRGNKTKLEKGWLPGVAPTGYLNERVNHTVIPDPERFDTVRKLWSLLLSQRHTAPEIMKIANEEWGFRTRKTKRMGGKQLTRSLIYKIFSNPFYCGIIKRDGQTYRGAHKAMISVDEFDKAQQILGRNTCKRPKKHKFTYTGIIRCGECGSMVTAEKKTKPSGRQYIYYHCTKRKPGRKCSQRSIRIEELENQIMNIINEVSISDDLRKWAVDYLKWFNANEIKDRRKIYLSQQKAFNDAQKKLDELVAMRFNGLLDDEEYASWKAKIIKEQVSLKTKMTDTEHRTSRWLELSENAFIFANKARIWFRDGDMETKREILKRLGSNFVLKDGKLHIQLQKPYLMISKKGENSVWLRDMDSNHDYQIQSLVSYH